MKDSSLIISLPIKWLSTEQGVAPDSVPDAVFDWLMELGSMTKRFEQHCQQVTVAPYQEKFITRCELSHDEADALPESQRYWMREVVLYGDEIPWLLGRTIVPEETLTGDDKLLVDLGTIPLGRYLFSSDNLTRDFIDIGVHQERWIRRSLLRLSGKPLLLTELFLPASPAYRT